MAKILLAVHGEGNGHMTRCKAILEHLGKEHELLIAADGRSFGFLESYTNNIIRVTSLHLAYRNNRISSWGTLILNLMQLPEIIRSSLRLNRAVKKFKPEIIVNDLHALACYLGILHRLPIVTIDNNQLVIFSKMNLPIKWLWAKVKALLAIRLLVPAADIRIIPSFVFPDKINKGVELVPPILRNEICRLRARKGRHVLVYQTSSSNRQLLDLLRGIKQDFIVYGFDKDKRIDNLVLKRFSEKGFLEDLRTARGVIMNGGFSLMTECIYLKKPILSIPVKGQIEQMINARELERQGLGMYSEGNDLKKIKQFLSALKVPMSTKFDYDLPFKRLDEAIKRLIS